jgi:DNA modification methylase
MEHEGISGFRPVVAKQIYDRYCPENAVVLDPCGGWGGRMLGAYCSDKVIRYDCIDASKNTCKGLEKVKDAFGRLCGGKEINVSCGAFEDQHLESGIYDMVFTSPPYFKKERYSEDGTQSCNRYEDYGIWKESFLSEFVDKSYDCLKTNGWFIVNIDNVKINNDEFSLQDDLKELALKKGFVLKETLFMKSRNRYVGTESGEPIFVFLKS